MAEAIDLGILLALAYQRFVDELRSSLAADGYDDQGRSDGYVLRVVDAGPVTVSALAELLGISKQGAGQIVDDMVRRGYLERYDDPDDGRARLLRLAPHGRDALAAARRFHRSYERRLRRTHGTEAVDTLRSMLEAMTGAEAATVRAMHV